MVEVTLRFVEQAEDDHRTHFRFTDCIAEIEGTGELDKNKYGEQEYKGSEYVGGLIFGYYEVHRRGHRFLISPQQFLDAVDSAIDQYEGWCINGSGI